MLKLRLAKRSATPNLPPILLLIIKDVQVLLLLPLLSFRCGWKVVVYVAAVFLLHVQASFVSTSRVLLQDLGDSFLAIYRNTYQVVKRQ